MCYFGKGNSTVIAAHDFLSLDTWDVCVVRPLLGGKSDELCVGWLQPMGLGQALKGSLKITDILVADRFEEQLLSADVRGTAVHKVAMG